MKKLLATLLTIIPFLGITQAYIPDQIPNTYVSDYAKVLSENELQSLNVKIYHLDTISSVQIAVIIIDHLPTDVAIEDYARELGRKWGVGHGNNGIVAVFALGDHKDRIETAGGVQGALPDMIAFEILESLKPQLRAQSYYSALDNMLNQIAARISPEAKEQRAIADAKAKEETKKALAVLATVVWWLLGIGAIIAIFLYIAHKKAKAKRLKEQALQDELDRIERAKYKKERAEMQKKYDEQQRLAAIAAAEEWARKTPAEKAAITKAQQEAVAKRDKEKAEEAEKRKKRQAESRSNTYIAPVIIDSGSSSYDSGSSSSSSSFGDFGGGGGFDGGGSSSSW